MPINFTMAEVLAIKNGQESEDLLAKINEAENLEKFKTLRDTIKTVVTANAAEMIKEQLTPLSIPDGVKEICLTYDLAAETLGFIVRSGGVKVDYCGVGSVSEEITLLVTKAESAKDNRPMSFIVSALGDSRVAHIKALRDFTDSAKPALDELYTNTEAKALSEGITEIPTGDKCRLQIKYRFDKPVEGSDQTKPGWCAPYITGLGKKISGGSSIGGNGGQGFRVTAPEGFSNWSEFGRSGDAQAQEIYKAAVVKHGKDFQKKQSFANMLKAAKHPVYLAQLESAREKATIAA